MFIEVFGVSGLSGGGGGGGGEGKVWIELMAVPNSVVCEQGYLLSL